MAHCNSLIQTRAGIKDQRAAIYLPEALMAQVYASSGEIKWSLVDCKVLEAHAIRCCALYMC